MPMLKKPPCVEPGTPMSSRRPQLKRSFNNLSPVCENTEVRELIAELKSSRNDNDALMDYVMGLKAESPDAKQTVLEHNVEVFRTESPEE